MCRRAAKGPRQDRLPQIEVKCRRHFHLHMPLGRTTPRQLKVLHVLSREMVYSRHHCRIMWGRIEYSVSGETRKLQQCNNIRCIIHVAQPQRHSNMLTLHAYLRSYKQPSTQTSCAQARSSLSFNLWSPINPLLLVTLQPSTCNSPPNCMKSFVFCIVIIYPQGIWPLVMMKMMLCS